MAKKPGKKRKAGPTHILVCDPEHKECKAVRIENA